MARTSKSSLAPGFRFHPTDEELVRYYLTRKVSGRSFRFDAISDVDVYKNEPWDLPSKSKMKTRDLEWYFFSVLDKKYGNGSKTNRATENGYWKTTGKDRAVYHRTRVVGMKKTLVYHMGRAPKGKRTNWVMHEYRLTDEELEKAGIAQDAFVLCRIFEKSGPGPKNGEKYGAPFVDEEWENDEVGCFPGEESILDDEATLGDDAYFNVDVLDESLDDAMPSEDVPVPPSFYYDEINYCNEDPRDFIDYEQKPAIGSVSINADSELGESSKWNDLPEHMIDPVPFYAEYGNESDIMNSLDMDYLLDEPYLETADKSSLCCESFLDSNEFANSMKADTSGLVSVDEYLPFFDEANEYPQDMGSSSKQMAGTEKVSDQQHHTDKAVNEGDEQQPVPNEHISDAHGNDGASSSSTKIPEPEKFKPDMDYSFIKKTGHFLEKMSYPSAFAPEYPSKDAVLRLNSASQSSSSVHVTAGMIRISDSAIPGSGTDGSFTKNMDVKIIFSITLPQGVSSANFLQLANTHSDKTGPSLWLGLGYFLFIWVLIISISFKVATSVCAL